MGIQHRFTVVIATMYIATTLQTIWIWMKTVTTKTLVGVVLVVVSGVMIEWDEGVKAVLVLFVMVLSAI